MKGKNKPLIGFAEHLVVRGDPIPQPFHDILRCSRRTAIGIVMVGEIGGTPRKKQPPHKEHAPSRWFSYTVGVTDRPGEWDTPGQYWAAAGTAAEKSPRSTPESAR
jgi:hypothetical protein